MTEGSVSRHLNKKSWPSFRLGLERGATNTEEESAGSEGQEEGQRSRTCQVTLTWKLRPLRYL